MSSNNSGSSTMITMVAVFCGLAVSCLVSVGGGFLAYQNCYLTDLGLAPSTCGGTTTSTDGTTEETATGADGTTAGGTTYKVSYINAVDNKPYYLSKKLTLLNADPSGFYMITSNGKYYVADSTGKIKTVTESGLPTGANKKYAIWNKKTVTTDSSKKAIVNYGYGRSPTQPGPAGKQKYFGISESKPVFVDYEWAWTFEKNAA